MLIFLWLIVIKNTFVSLYLLVLYCSEGDGPMESERWERFCQRVIDQEILRKRGQCRMVELVQSYSKMFPDDAHHS